MLAILEDPFLKKIKTITHGFFTRQGGVSEGIYASLNCAPYSFDYIENVNENRRRAMSHFGYPIESLISVRNVHGNTAIIVEAASIDYYSHNADAMVTSNPKIMLGSDSADCPIVLLADEISNVIGLAHAGWKGAKSGIIEATVEKMIFLGAKPQFITAAVSPCIHQKSYEVDLKFYQDFLMDDKENQNYFINSNKPNHFLFDLRCFVKDKLLKLNLKFVSIEVAFDTYCDENLFYSCRRATHQKGSAFGGQLSCISII